MQIEILIKIAGLGLLVSVIMTLLKQSGREELAALVAVVGLAIGTLLVLETVNSLMELARHNGGYGLLTGLATGVLLLMMLLGQTEELGVSLRELTGFGQLSSEYLSRVVRILGLACLTEAGSRICRDGGQGNIALKVELCGRVMILCAMLPAVREVLRSAETVLAEIGP